MLNDMVQTITTDVDGGSPTETWDYMHLAIRQKMTYLYSSKINREENFTFCKV